MASFPLFGQVAQSPSASPRSVFTQMRSPASSPVLRIILIRDNNRASQRSFTHGSSDRTSPALASTRAVTAVPPLNSREHRGAGLSDSQTRLADTVLHNALTSAESMALVVGSLDCLCDLLARARFYLSRGRLSGAGRVIATAEQDPSKPLPRGLPRGLPKGLPKGQ